MARKKTAAKEPIKYRDADPDEDVMAEQYDYLVDHWLKHRRDNCEDCLRYHTLRAVLLMPFDEKIKIHRSIEILPQSTS